MPCEWQMDENQEDIFTLIYLLVFFSHRRWINFLFCIHLYLYFRIYHHLMAMAGSTTTFDICVGYSCNTHFGGSQFRDRWH